MAGLSLGPVPGLALLGGGTAFPARTLDNAGVLRVLGLAPADDERLRFQSDGLTATLGVKERAWAHVVGTPFDHAQEESTIDLAARAAARALESAGLGADDVDALLVSTSTPPRFTSTVSAPVGARLGLSTMCLDVRSGCAAGIASFAQAALLVQAGARHVLVVGTETFSKVIPPGHKMAALALADGAAALVVGRGTSTLEALWFCTDGTRGGLVHTPGAMPPTVGDVERGAFFLAGQPQELEAEIGPRYVEAIGAALAHGALQAADVDLYVPHQTSRPTIEGVAAQVGIPRDRVWLAVERHANVGAAGLLTAMVEARAAGRFPAGARVLAAAVGGGMSFGALVWREGGPS